MASGVLFNYNKSLFLELLFKFYCYRYKSKVYFSDLKVLESPFYHMLSYKNFFVLLQCALPLDLGTLSSTGYLE